MKRADYEAQLAERSYLEVDPSNRLEPATLEKHWEEALQRYHEVKASYDAFVNREAKVATVEQKAQVLALANVFLGSGMRPAPRLRTKSACYVC